MITVLMFFIEFAAIVAAIIFIIKKKHTISVILMCIALFIHIISNWNFIFGLMLRIYWGVFH
mgnify:CR=1 FL=1